MAPYTGGSYDLIADRVIFEGVKERKTRRTTSTQRGKTVFDRLVAAGKRLMTVITHNEGGTNKVWLSLQIRLMHYVINGTGDYDEDAVCF